MVQVVMQMIALTVAVGTIVYAVPFFIVPAVVIAYVHLWFARGYVNASRDLRRIESNTRSPIISSFSELVVGIVTGTSSVRRDLIILNYWVLQKCAHSVRKSPS